MRPGARIRAASEILDGILGHHRPVPMALADWGKSHRFAGSGDRNAIGGLVYDSLRRRASIGWAMGADTPRALALGAAAAALGLSAEEIPALCDGSQYAMEPLSSREVEGLTRSLEEAPPFVQADVPEWLWPDFERLFGGRAIAEGQAMSRRAPADLRVNALKATREKVSKALSDFRPEATPYSPFGLRVAPPRGPERTPNLEAEAAFQAGWFEIQDEGSQIAAALAGSVGRRQVLDLCAGAGGKSLAMAAAMQNSGQIYAFDQDKTRLKPIFDRIRRAGVRNIQVLRAGDTEALERLEGRFDVVLVDAPCTGTGTWRRRPDAKWRLRPMAVEQRTREQRDVLTRAARMVKAGGRVVYVTCSVLPAENNHQIEWFLSAHPGFAPKPVPEVWRECLPGEAPLSADGRTDSLLLTPASHGTDGFFISVLEAPAAGTD